MKTSEGGCGISAVCYTRGAWWGNLRVNDATFLHGVHDAMTIMLSDIADWVDVGGRRLYLECQGSGSYNVILQSGYGNAGDVWHLAESYPPAVMEGVHTFARVCAYDRPGSIRILTDDNKSGPSLRPSRSDSVAMPRSGADVVDEVHTLLIKAREPGPYVMVGHSLGGAFTLLYARSYPDQVRGLVLVDPAQPFMRRLFPPQVWKTYQEIGLHPDSPLPGYQEEAYDLDSTYNQIEAAPSLRSMPVIILTRSKPEPVPDSLPAGPVREVLTTLNSVWPQAQEEFAASIPGARLIPVPDTTHNVHNQRPDIVIDAIRQVVAEATSRAMTT